MAHRFLIAVSTLAFALPLATAQQGKTGAAEPQTNLSFMEALELAAQSPAVRLAEGQLELARHQLSAASGVVSANFSADVSQAWQLGGESASDIGPLSAEATLNVVPYGDTADAVTGARYDLQRAQATLGATRRDALVTTATQYLEALRYSQEETADEAVVAVAQTALAATQAQLGVGAASSADVLDAQITLSEAQNDLAEVALSQDQALATLTQTLGVGVAAVAGEPPSAALPKSVEVTAAMTTDAATLLAGRSDLLSARLSVAEAELSAAQTRRNILPSGSVSAAYGGSGVQLGSSIGTETYQPTLSLAYDPDGAADEGSSGGSGNGVTLQASVSIPLRSGSGATVAAAETNIVNAQQQLEQTQAQAQLELQAAQAQLSTAQNSLSSAQALVAQRQQSLTTSRQRLTLGLVPAYDVQNAEAELLGAQVDLARLRDSVLISQLTLLETLAQDPLEVF